MSSGSRCEVSHTAETPWIEIIAALAVGDESRKPRSDRSGGPFLSHVAKLTAPAPHPA
jgi:hypothetical protein